MDTNGTRLPYFDNVIYTVVPDMNAHVLRFLERRERRGWTSFTPDDYDQFKAAAAKGKFKLVEPGIGLETTFFWFNENTNVNPKTGKPLCGPGQIEMVSQHEIPPGLLVCH